jgi:F0F1-type ATP synthase membrane subunit b/b'
MSAVLLEATVIFIIMMTLMMVVVVKCPQITDFIEQYRRN